jgi:hypothetical protein
VRWLLVLAAGWGVALAQAQPDLTQLPLLERIRIRAAENLSAQPNYTCHETIERGVRQPGSGSFKLRDTIQLEVALVGGRELFSPGGASEFKDAKITDLVTGGTIANGNFALHAHAVFLSDGPEFHYRGRSNWGNTETLDFDYLVKRELSGWEVRVDDKTGFVGYQGSFRVDATTLDLVELSVETNDIPSFVTLRSARDTMGYQRIPIGRADFLLPRSSEMIVIALNGIESRNRTLFHGCRQYAGESVLTFDEAPADSPAAN